MNTRQLTNLSKAISILLFFCGASIWVTTGSPLLYFIPAILGVLALEFMDRSAKKEVLDILGVRLETFEAMKLRQEARRKK